MPVSRHGTPQSHSTSRPSSRNHVRRVSSNLGPNPHGTPPPPGSQNGFAYMPNPSLYNPNVHSTMNQHRPGQYPQYGPQAGPQGTPPQMHHGLPPHGLPPNQGPQHFQNAGVASQHVGMVQGSHPPVYMTAAGRGSMPPAFAPNSSEQERTGPAQEDSQENTSGGSKVEHGQSPPQPNSFSKSRSIFTPIDDRGSVLARHFGAGAPIYESPRGNQALKVEAQEESTETRPASSRAKEHTRTQSISSAPELQPPMRTNSGSLPSKRPQLKVQIPSETSDRESAAGSSSGNKTATPAKDNPPTGVVLPPPSPSAGAILSAGAQGPPNPFARPPPPGATSQGSSYAGNSGTSNNNSSSNNANTIETPISALPSRFVSDALLPSPSSFFPEWGFGRSGPDSNLLPSPLTFPTPAVQSGPSFSREDEQDKKRKSPDSGDSAEGANKKPKA